MSIRFLFMNLQMSLVSLCLSYRKRAEELSVRSSALFQEELLFDRDNSFRLFEGLLQPMRVSVWPPLC